MTNSLKLSGDELRGTSNKNRWTTFTLCDAPRHCVLCDIRPKQGRRAVCSSEFAKTSQDVDACKSTASSVRAGIGARFRSECRSPDRRLVGSGAGARRFLRQAADRLRAKRCSNCAFAVDTYNESMRSAAGAQLQWWEKPQQLAPTADICRNASAQTEVDPHANAAPDTETRRSRRSRHRSPEVWAVEFRGVTAGNAKIP